MSDGEPHTTSIPISYSKILSSFGWLGDWGCMWEGLLGGVNRGASEVSLESNEVD